MVDYSSVCGEEICVEMYLPKRVLTIKKTVRSLKELFSIIELYGLENIVRMSLKDTMQVIEMPVSPRFKDVIELLNQKEKFYESK